MLGVFDSGRGGLGALARLRACLPDADVAYLADTKHLPYGQKSAEELLPLIESGLWRLCSLGCEKILIACVTASSLHSRLPKELRHIAVPIVDAAADAAVRATKNERIGIVATERTVREGVLCRAIKDRSATLCVTQGAAPSLVTLVEEGVLSPSDPRALRAVWQSLLPHLSANADTLVLGCTHFSALAPVFHRLCPHITLIPSGEVGADAFLSHLTDADKAGVGRTIYL